jgi:hypothetical protein
MVVSDESEGMCEEAIVGCFAVLARHLARNNTKTMGQDCQSPAGTRTEFLLSASQPRYGWREMYAHSTYSVLLLLKPHSCSHGDNASGVKVMPKPGVNNYYLLAVWMGLLGSYNRLESVPRNILQLKVK